MSVPDVSVPECRYCASPLRFGNVLVDFCDPHPSMPEEMHCAHRWARDQTERTGPEAGFPWTEMAAYRPSAAELSGLASRTQGLRSAPPLRLRRWLRTGPYL